MKSYRYALLASTVASAFSFAQSAYAQVTQLETVTVTAEKRNEDIQKVPLQVTAFSNEDLASANVKNTQQVLNLVPNVNLAHSYTFLNSFVTIRGVSEINNADAPLSVVVDGVPQNNQKQLMMDLFDVQQVQILMGPQGGLYGRNAIGGAMIITTNKPTNDFAGSIDATYGNGNSYSALGTLSGPIISDKLVFGLDVNLQGAGGLIKNTYLNRTVDAVNHDDTIRGRLVAYPTSWLTLDLKASYNDFKAGAIWDSDVSSNNANDIEPPISDFLGQTTGHVADTTFKWDADIGFATLTGISGYTDLIEQNRGDLDFTNPVANPGGFLGFLGPVGQGQNLVTDIASQELRLVSSDPGPFRWVVGAYVNHTNKSLLTRVFFDTTHTPNQFDIAGQRLLQINERDSNDAWSIYGQADYDITKKLTVTAALRNDADDLQQTNPDTGAVRKTSEHSPEPKAILTYHFDDDALGYASYSTGFRAGGFNGPGVAIASFAPEKLTNYEAGFKTSWFDQRLIVNGDYYYSVDHNFQFFFVDVGTGSQVIANLDRVHINGLELNAQALVADGLKLFGGLGTTNTKIEQSTTFLGVNGNHSPKNIPWSLKLGFQYDRELTQALNGTVRFDYTHDAKQYWQIDNVDVQKSLDLFNARAGVEFGNYGVYLWGKNLSGERYYEDYNPGKFSGTSDGTGSLAEPRSFGVEVQAHL